VAGNPFAPKPQPDPNLAGAPQARNAPPPADPNAPDPNATSTDEPKEDGSVGQFESFDACVAAQLADGKDMLSAHRLCGALQDRTPPADPKAPPPAKNPDPNAPPAPDAASQQPDAAARKPLFESVVGYRGNAMTAALPQGDHSVPGTKDMSDQGQVAYADTNTAHVNSVKGDLLARHLIDDHKIDAGNDQEAVHAAQHVAPENMGISDTYEALGSTGARVIKQSFRLTESELAAVKATLATMTAAAYPWPKCIADQTAKGASADSAARICGAIKAQNS
jgi:hypothetical protein